MYTSLFGGLFLFLSLRVLVRGGPRGRDRNRQGACYSLLQVPGLQREKREAAIWGNKQRQGSLFSLLCLLHAPCRVACRPRSDSRDVGACYQNNFFHRVSLRSLFVGGDTASDRPKSSVAGNISHAVANTRWIRAWDDMT